MTVTVADITALKTIRADTGIFLRFVNSKLSWYQSTPSSSATGDDDLVVTPNVGTGRWLKQYATTTFGLSVVNISSNTTLSTGNLYLVDNTSGNITVTLPSTATATTKLVIFAAIATTVLKKIIVNNNSRKINGVLGNKEITVLNDFVELTYISDSVGWIVTQASNSTALKDNISLFTCTYSGTPGNFTGGAITYLGTQKNTLSYQQPCSSAAGRTQRLRLFWGGAQWSNFALFPLNSITRNSLNTTGNTSNVPIEPLIFDFLATGGIRLTDFLFTIQGVNDFPSTRPDTVSIFAADALLETGMVETTTSFVNNATTNAGRGFLFSNLTNLVTLNSSNILRPGNASSTYYSAVGTDYQFLIPGINASNVSRYIIVQFGKAFNLAANVAFSHIDFYGDLLTA